jgi:hypothetical protein
MEGGKAMRIETMGKPEGCKLLRVSVELSDPAGSDSLIGGYP